MGLMDYFWPQQSQPPSSAPRADIGGVNFDSLNDPRLAMFVRDGGGTAAGVAVNERTALKNPAVFRSVSLISYAIGMLPLHLIDSKTKEKASDHPLFKILHREPNNWQSAFDFRSLMQMRALVKGNAYALILRNIKKEVIRLIPLDPDRVKPNQQSDWRVTYDYQPLKGDKVTYQPEEILHLRGMSIDGIEGISLVAQARDAISLALAADLATARVFKNGSFIDGTLNVPKDTKLSPDAFSRLKEGWNARYSGSDNAGKTPLLEDGVEYKSFGASPKDAQSNETRGRQVEEIARIFGVPRPLLMVDETSWGSGIDVLGQFFVRYGLNPWFEAWQQAIERSVLVGPEKDKYDVKFNAGALIRGNMSAQGDFFAKALGAGGSQKWMTANEVREVLDMPSHPDGDSLGHDGRAGRLRAPNTLDRRMQPRHRSVIARDETGRGCCFASSNSLRP